MPPRRQAPGEVFLLTKNQARTVPPGSFISELAVPRKLGEIQKGELELQVAPHIDGARTVKEIAEVAGLSLVETKLVVMELSKQKLIEIGAPAEQDEVTSPNLTREKPPR